MQATPDNSQKRYCVSGTPFGNGCCPLLSFTSRHASSQPHGVGMREGCKCMSMDLAVQTGMLWNTRALASSTAGGASYGNAVGGGGTGVRHYLYYYRSHTNIQIQTWETHGQ